MEGVLDENQNNEEDINKDVDTDLASNIATSEADLDFRRNNKADDRNVQRENEDSVHVMASDPTVAVSSSLMHEICMTLNSLKDISAAGMAQMREMRENFTDQMKVTNSLLSTLIQIATDQTRRDSPATYRRDINQQNINGLQEKHFGHNIPPLKLKEENPEQKSTKKIVDTYGPFTEPPIVQPPYAPYFYMRETDHSWPGNPKHLPQGSSLDDIITKQQGDNRHASSHSDAGITITPVLDSSTESKRSSDNGCKERRLENQKEMDQGVTHVSNNREPMDVGDRSSLERLATAGDRLNNEQSTTVHNSLSSGTSVKHDKGSSFGNSGMAQTGGQNGQTPTARVDQQRTEQNSVSVLNVQRVSERSTGARPKRYAQKERNEKTWTIDQNRSRGISALGLTLTSGSDSETTRLQQALDRAEIPEEIPAPKARSFDTVLCLDISSSMSSGGAFDQMIKTVNTFIDGIEDAAAEVEEDIAVVTFGVQANVIQHLTNDFSRVRDAIARIVIGGKSPFYEAMVVCLAAINGKGGAISVSGEYDVYPRIIFFTDGHITEGSNDPDALDRVTDATNTRAHFSRLMMDLCPKNSPTMPHPIIFVPVGEHTDRKFLESQATLNDGKIVEPEDIKSLCQYFKVQETIGKVVVCLRNQDSTQTNEGQTKALIQALVPSISDQQLTEVIEAVNKEMEKPGRVKTKRVHPTDFDAVFEDTDGVLCGDRLRLGTRVVRGPDWSWNTQDGGKAGTVVQHEESRHPFTWVLWDTGEWNRYPYGPDMGYHIWETKECPVLKQADGQLQIGMTVKKAPSLESKPGENVGVIIRKSKDGKRVKVRWDNSSIEAYSAEDVVFSDPFEQYEQREMKKEPTIAQELFGHSLEEEDEIENKVWVWQWRDDWGNWHLYSQEQINQLEREYFRRKTGTCIVQRKGKSFRVMFNRWAERDCEKGLERDVQRTKITLDDLCSLEEAEKLYTY